MSAPAAESFLRIGGITIAIAFEDERLSYAFEEAVRRFAVPPSTPDVAVFATTMNGYEPPSGPLLFDSGAVWRLYGEPGGGWRIECRSAAFGDTPYRVAKIDAGVTRVDVASRLVGASPSSPIEFPLDELLINALLTRRDAVEIHSCGVISGGAGYLFAGNSGDGKTTTARLWLGTADDIVSDDRVILRHEDGAWWMYGTPWHGEAEICSPSRAPLAGIFILHKAASNVATPLGRSEAVARLLSCAFPPFHDRAGIDSVLGTLARIADDVPVSRLSFVNDASVVDYVRSITASEVTA